MFVDPALDVDPVGVPVIHSTVEFEPVRGFVEFQTAGFASSQSEAGEVERVVEFTDPS